MSCICPAIMLRPEEAAYMAKKRTLSTTWQRSAFHETSAWILKMKISCPRARGKGCVYACSVFGKNPIYLRVCKQRPQSRPEMGPQGQCVDDQVLISRGQLHEAGEALEAAEAVVLQIHRQLISCGQAGRCRLQGRQGVNEHQRCCLQALQMHGNGGHRSERCVTV